jgi:DNA-binding winged helix-turn-helix (wHTH) protein/tetratricopeptide (TPR) repeat protein
MSATADSIERAPGGVSLWRFGNVQFDERSFELRVGGIPADVERAPLRVLRELLEQPGQLVSREALLAAVWKRKPDTISRNALTNAVGKLRRAIGDEEQQIIVASAGEGYRLAAEVERRALPPLQSLTQILKAGQPPPLRPNWMLRERIDTTQSSEVWKAEHAKTRELRVFKYAGDGFQLAALRREVTVSRLLQQALGARPEFVRIHDWNFDQPPYFIESDYGGEDLNRWAAAQGGMAAVPLQRRLELIAELADALALAHSVGALHKDLKPGNVLVQSLGDTTQLRVVDFGSARLLDPELLDQYQITRMSLPEADSTTGTPLYLAPELLAGHPPTIASDVYSLGVLLYQSVVGDLQRPIAPGWEADIADPLLREDIALAAEGNPDKRLSTAAGLAERLRSIEKRRQQREAAEQSERHTRALKEKLERADMRRRGLRLAVIVLAIGLLSTLGLYFKLLSVQKQREAALVQADEEAAVSQQIKAYVLSLFDAASPQRTGGKPIEPRALVDNGKAELEQQFQDRPLLRARMLATVGNLYCKLGVIEECRQELEQALALQRADAQADPLITAQFLQQVAEAYTAEARYDDAERSLHEAQTIIEAHPSAVSPQQLAEVLQYLGAALQKQQKTTDSIALLERARALMMQNGHDTIAARKTLGALASAYMDSGRNAEGLQLGQQMVKLVAEQVGTGDLRYFDALNDESNLMLAAFRYPDTEAAMRQVLVGYLRYYGADSQQVFDIKGNLADVLSREGGHLPEAADLTKQVVEGMRLKAGPDNPDFASALTNHGEILELHGDYTQAEPYLREAYRIIHAHYGDTNLETYVIGDGLGRLLNYLGKSEEALLLLKREVPASIEGDAAQFQRGRQLKQLGDCYIALRQFGLASQTLDHADAAFKAVLPEGHDAFAAVRHSRARLLMAQQRYADALPLLRLVVADYARTSSMDDPPSLDAQASIAECLLRLGQIAEERSLIAQIGPMIDRELAPTHRAAIQLQRLRSESKT